MVEACRARGDSGHWGDAPVPGRAPQPTGHTKQTTSENGAPSILTSRETRPATFTTQDLVSTRVTSDHGYCSALASPHPSLARA